MFSLADYLTVRWVNFEGVFLRRKTNLHEIGLLRLVCKISPKEMKNNSRSKSGGRWWVGIWIGTSLVRFKHRCHQIPEPDILGFRIELTIQSFKREMNKCFLTIALQGRRWENNICYKHNRRIHKRYND